MNLNLCAVLTCTDQPYITEPLHLCQQHALMVSINVTDVLYSHARTAALPTAGLDIEQAKLASSKVWDQPSHRPVVYFLTNGDRVKIGTSTNITARVSALALRRANAALLLQGGRDLEDTLHKHFADDRINNTEWFVLSPRIQSYITRRLGSQAPLRQPVSTPRTIQKAIIPAPRVEYLERPETATGKILEALRAFSDGVQITYLHKDTIGQLADLKETTLNGALSRMKKAGQIHSGPDRGTYGLGPEPTDPGE